MEDDKEQLILSGEGWRSDIGAKPRTLADISEEYGIVAPHQAAKDLIGETFAIQAMRRVESNLGGVGYYYFVLALDPKTGESYTTTLGGQAVVQVLDRLIEKGVTDPVTVTLDFVEQGKYDGYYVLR